jgi:hypothetical protein
MVGTSLGLGIGLQGQPRQYGEMAQRKLAGDAAIKKQEAAADKEYLDFFRQGVNAIGAKVLPWQKEQLEREVAVSLANMTKFREDRNLSGIANELVQLKNRTQKYTQNYDQAYKALNDKTSIYDTEALNAVISGDEVSVQELANLPDSGIAIQNGVVVMDNLPATDLNKEINKLVKPENFMLTDETRRIDGIKKPFSIKKLSPSAIEAHVQSITANPSLRRQVGIQVRNEFRQKGEALPDAKTFEDIKTQRLAESTRSYLNQMRKEVGEGGYENIITVNTGAASPTSVKAIADGTTDIFLYQNKEDSTPVSVTAAGQINFGNISSVTPRGANVTDYKGFPIAFTGNENLLLGTGQTVPMLSAELTKQDVLKLVDFYEKTNNNKALNILKDTELPNRKGAPIPTELEGGIYQLFPNKVTTGIITSAQVMKGAGAEGGESRNVAAEYIQMMQIISASEKDEQKLNAIKDALGASKKNTEDRLKSKIIEIKGTNQPKATQPTQNKTEQGKYDKYKRK